MLVPRDLIDNLDAIIERTFTSFVFLLLGERFLTTQQKIEVESLGLLVGSRPLIELLYILVKGRTTPQYLKDQTLNQLLSQLAASGILPEPRTRNAATLTSAEETIKLALDEAKQRLKKSVKEAIIEVNTSYKNELTNADTVVKQAEVKNSHLNTLLKIIGGTALVAATYSAFRTGFTTAMTNLINETVVDDLVTTSAIASSSGIAQNPMDLLVYKQVVMDDRLSPECRKFHLNPDNTPRIYKLGTLIKNGTNIGKPRSQWKPVVGGTHANCRCVLKLASELNKK